MMTVVTDWLQAYVMPVSEDNDDSRHWLTAATDWNVQIINLCKLSNKVSK